MDNTKGYAEVQLTSREERERVGRAINAGFARVENAETLEGSTEVPTTPVAQPLTEEEIRRRVGSGNFEAAQDDKQTGSINS